MKLERGREGIGPYLQVRVIMAALLNFFFFFGKKKKKKKPPNPPNFDPLTTKNLSLFNSPINLQMLSNKLTMNNIYPNGSIKI